MTPKALHAILTRHVERHPQEAEEQKRRSRYMPRRHVTEKLLHENNPCSFCPACGDLSATSFVDVHVSVFGDVVTLPFECDCGASWAILFVEDKP